eukprot:1162147-Pelagomonas_calceolata.AAC.12
MALLCVPTTPACMPRTHFSCLPPKPPTHLACLALPAHSTPPCHPFCTTPTSSSSDSSSSGCNWWSRSEAWLTRSCSMGCPTSLRAAHTSARVMRRKRGGGAQRQEREMMGRQAG